MTRKAFISLAIAALSLFTSWTNAEAATGNKRTYTAIFVQYRNAIDSKITVEPADPLTTCIAFSKTEKCDVTVEFKKNTTREQLAKDLAEAIKKKFPKHADKVSVNGASVIVTGTSQGDSVGTPDEPKESSSNHNRPWLKTYTKTV